MRTYKIVKVEWNDITSHHNWKEQDELKDLGCLRNISCGILTKVKKGHIGVTQLLAENNQTSETLVIPRHNVTSIEIVGTFKA